MVCRFLLVILSLFSLSGCIDGTCLDADDFGFARFVVPAKYSSSQLEGQSDNQVAPWLNTGYLVNGKPLVIVVKNWNARDNENIATQLSAWCPWYGANSGATGLSALFGDAMSAYKSASSTLESIPFFPTTPFAAQSGFDLALYDEIASARVFHNALSDICKNLTVCQWASGEMCTDTVDAQIINAPCLMTKGVGLYALITGPGADPNSSVATKANPAAGLNPAGIAFHVGDPQIDYTLYDMDSKGRYEPAGGVIYNYNGYDPANYNNGGLYFKILDKHYDDNSGQYLVVVKSGLEHNAPDPIQFVTNMVAQYFFGSSAFLNNLGDSKTQGIISSIFSGVTVNRQGVVESMYKTLIQNPFYKNAVRGILTIYLIFTGLYYLAGILHLTTKEVIVRIVKIILVATLLDPDLGWSFFHDYLFVFFIEGVQQIIQIIQTSAATGPGSSSVIALMLAPQTIAKLSALLFTSWLAWLYIALYLVVFVLLVSVTLRAAVLYLNCLIMIGMIIIMGPIFLCFMLFSWTKGLFENWLRQLTSYAIQPIILITVLAFVSMLVRHEIYVSLGFPVCKKYFLDSVFNTVDPTGRSSSIFSWWFPSPMNGDFSDDLVTIPVPEDHNVLDANGNTTDVFCGAYACNEERYIQLPFLDPNNPADMVRKRNFFSGSFAQMTGLLYIVLLCYLLYRFNESTVSIARALTDTSANETSMDRATQTPGFMATAKGLYKAAKTSIGTVKRLALMEAARGRGGVKAEGEGASDTVTKGPIPGDVVDGGKRASDTVIKGSGKEASDTDIKGVGGREGSKDDGSGTATKGKTENPLSKKGFESLDKAKDDLSKPLKERDMKGFVKKSGAKDDFDVRLSDKEFVLAKPSASLEEAKANLKALKPIGPAPEKIIEDQKISETLDRDAPAKADPKKFEQNIIQEEAKESGERTAPPKQEMKVEVTNEETIERVAPPKNNAPSVAKENVAAEVIIERTKSPVQGAEQKVHVKIEVESAPPLPEPSSSDTPPSPPPPPPSKAPDKNHSYMDSTVSSRAKERLKSEPNSPRQAIKTSSSAPALLEGKEKVVSSEKTIETSRSAPELSSKYRGGYDAHTESSTQRTKETLANRERIEREKISSAPSSSVASSPISSPRSSSADLSINSGSSKSSRASLGSVSSDITRSTAASRANADGGRAKKKALDVRAKSPTKKK